MASVEVGQVGFGGGAAGTVGFPHFGVVVVTVLGGDLAARGAAGPVSGADLFGHGGGDLVSGR